MLGKNWLLTTFCAFLLISTTYGAWERIEVQALVNTDQYLLTDGSVVKLVGIEGVDIQSPTWDERCLVEHRKIQLSTIFSDYELSIKRVDEKSGYMKFGAHDLGQFLVSQGLAVATTQTYLSAQQTAQKAHLGRWGQCDPHLNIVKWRKQRGRTPWFWDKYHTYMVGPSVGRVTGVLAGNLLELENGLRVKLQDLEVPDIQDNRRSYQCFSRRSRDYLKSLVLGRRVSIRHQYNLLPKYKTIERQVYLPQTSKQNALWLNQAMIAAGQAKLSPVSENEALINIQNQVWENPNGAWTECLAKHLEVSEAPEEIIADIIYDEACPIKGNIAGSKKNPKKTYHTPLSGWYKRLAPEECFADEEAAEMAGFTKIK